jgi:hypothetical protein
MSNFPYPLVVYTHSYYSNISNPQSPIFGIKDRKCIVNSILLSNLTDSKIFVTICAFSENFILIPQIEIDAKKTIDALKEIDSIMLEPGQLLYASSDFSANLFNADVQYKVLSERYV